MFYVEIMAGRPVAAAMIVQRNEIMNLEAISQDEWTMATLSVELASDMGTLQEIGHGIYMHDVVVHQRNFVDPDDDEIHTQNIENSWMRAKKKLRRQHGTSAALFPSYLSEFLWRNLMRQPAFGKLLATVASEYVV